MILAEVVKELTPRKIVKQIKFEKPFIISPNIFGSFEDLYEVRDKIRNLEYVAVKDDAMYKHYHTFDRVQLSNDIKKQFKIQQSKVLILPNQFPDWLPEDVNQRVAWIKARTPNEEALRYILAMLHEERIEKFILFERPLNTSTKLVKGSIPQIRHIHIWTKQ